MNRRPRLERLQFGRSLLPWFLCLCLLWAGNLSAADKKVVLVAGSASHGSGQHEFWAGCLLLQKCLANVQGLTTSLYSNGWPNDIRAFDGANAIFIYCDGGDGHPAI